MGVGVGGSGGSKGATPSRGARPTINLYSKSPKQLPIRTYVKAVRVLKTLGIVPISRFE